MATIDETLAEIFEKTDEEFLKEMEKAYAEVREAYRKKVNSGDASPDEAGRKLMESFDFHHYTKKEDQ